MFVTCHAGPGEGARRRYALDRTPYRFSEARKPESFEKCAKPLQRLLEVGGGQKCTFFVAGVVRDLEICFGGVETLVL